MALRYIDFTNGNDSDDGTTPTPQGAGVGPWATIGKAATTLTAGDEARVRGGMTQTLAADINFTNDGTLNNYIKITGIYTAAGSDDWSDGDTTRPIIDANNAAYHFILNGDNFWQIEGLKVTKSTYTAGAFYVYNSSAPKFIDCEISGNNSVGMRMDICHNGQITDCIFYDNGSYNLQMRGANYYLLGCKIYGGVGGTSYGMDISGSHATIYMRDCLFGNSGSGTSAHATADIYGYKGMQVYGRNVKLDSTTQVTFQAYNGRGFVSLEDDEQTHEAFKKWSYTGVISRSTAVERSGAGGTAWSILGEGNNHCGAEQPLYLIGDWLRGIPIYLDGTAQTITLYAYATSWAGLPTVSQFVVELEHYEGAGDWDIDTSADTFAANDGWESFAITLTPSAAGPAYLRVYLKDYEDGTEKVYIDPKPVIS